eukprot:Tbor_TRINITY_DN5511_c1_g1::TRINITY_DN5511_c1_g1_i1::g.13648::m.13648
MRTFSSPSPTVSTSCPKPFTSHLFSRFLRYEVCICPPSLMRPFNPTSGIHIYTASHRACQTDNSGIKCTSTSVDTTTSPNLTSKIQRNVRRILLVRNGESDANVNVDFYCKVPDWKIGITPRGVQQMRNCGRRVSMLTNGGPIYIYFSPYARSVESMKVMLRGGLEGSTYSPNNGFSENISSGITSGIVLHPVNIIGIREDARLRDGDIGRFSSPEDLRDCLIEREEYGKFFYRFPQGESPADVYDRVSSFMDAFQREQTEFPPDTTVVILTHGLTIRTFVKKWFHLKIETFHKMTSPPPGSAVELSRITHDVDRDPIAPPKFKLSKQSIKWLNLPSSLSEENGYAFRNKRVLGSISTGAPFV